MSLPGVEADGPSRHGRAAALARLAAADEARTGPPWRSLDPRREAARSLRAIGTLVLAEAGAEAGAALTEVFAEGLVTIATAMQRAFPDNIFGDLELLAATLWRGARAAGTEPASRARWLRAQCQQVADLQDLFGRGTAIRFRYVHDFVYGYDWAKWVAREPSTRDGVGPFDPPFLDFMQRRGGELLALIAEGRDRKYPPLPDASPRNPFGFSREPAAEIELHEHLAREGLIPVEAWRVDAQPRWDRPYRALRREHARRLGLDVAEPSDDL